MIENNRKLFKFITYTWKKPTAILLRQYYLPENSIFLDQIMIEIHLAKKTDKRHSCFSPLIGIRLLRENILNLSFLSFIVLRYFSKQNEKINITAPPQKVVNNH